MKNKISLFSITVQWTDWLTDESEEFDYQNVLYMYATNVESIYIGEAGRQSIWECFKRHERDSVNEWIKEHVKSPVKLKIGMLALGKGRRFSLQLLHDIQNLLIFEETKRGNCKANVSSTRSRTIIRPGLVIVNEGEYNPLLKEYRETLK